MNINAIKERLKQLNQGYDDKPKVDYKKFFWSPIVGKTTIRIVPLKNNPDYPFIEYKFHNKISKYPIFALSNIGQQDPVEQFIEKLKEGDDKDSWSLAGKLTPRVRVYVPIIVRGEEDKGIRFWGFSSTVYKALLALAEDEDVGDYTSITDGWDLIVTRMKVDGKKWDDISVRIKPKQTPLSDNKKEVEQWLNEQPDPVECFYKSDYDYIKKQLQNYLTPQKSGDDFQSETEESSEDILSETSPTESNQVTDDFFDELFSK